MRTKRRYVVAAVWWIAGWSFGATHPCAQDVERLCPEANNNAIRLAFCLRDRFAEVSRECSDYQHASLVAMPAQIPIACYADILRRCDSPWTAVKETGACLARADSLSQACVAAQAHPPARLNYQNYRPASAYNFLRTLIDAAGLLDRGADKSNRWNWFVNEAGLCMRFYARDPEPLLPQSVARFLQAFDLPQDWDSRSIPRPLAAVDASEIGRSFNEGLQAFDKLSKNGEWPPLTAEESHRLKDQLAVLFPKNHPIAFPGLDATVQSLRDAVNGKYY